MPLSTVGPGDFASVIITWIFVTQGMARISEINT